MNRIVLPLLLGLSLAPVLCWAAEFDLEQQRAILEIEKLGGKVAVDDKCPGKPVIGVSLNECNLTDALLVELTKLPRLRELDLNGYDVTDATLLTLKGLPRLQSLNLSRTQVTDAGLEYLKGLPELQSLGLWATEATDAGITGLHKALPNCDITLVGGKTSADAEVEKADGHDEWTRLRDKVRTALNKQDPVRGKQVSANEPGRFVLKGQKGAIHALAVSPDGKSLMSVSEQETKVWDIGSQTTRWNAEGFRKIFPGTQEPFVFSPDSRWIAFAPRDADFDPADDTDEKRGTVELRDSATGQLALKIALVTMNFDASDTSIAFSPDSRFVAATGLRGEVWDIGARKLHMRFGEKPRYTYQLLFSPNGKILIGTGADWKKDGLQGTGRLTPTGAVSTYTGEVSTAIWEAGTGKQLADIRYGEFNYAAALSPDAKLLAITNGWDKARLYEIPSGKLVRELRGVEEDFLSFTPDGKQLVTALYRGSSAFVVRIADVGTGHVEGTLRRTTRTEHAGVQSESFSARAVVFSPTTSLVAVLGEENDAARILETKTGRELTLFRGRESGLASITFFPNERRLAAGHENGLISIWDVPRLGRDKESDQTHDSH